jgi:hypothetical protein
MNKQKSRFVTLLPVAVACTALILLIGLSINDMNARQQQLTGNENHVITLDQATKYVQNYTSNPTAPTIKGAYFGRNIFDKILSQPGCIGLRYYYAKKDDGTATLVLVGVDGTGNDMTQGVLAEESLPCPPLCPAPNPLNK